MTAMWQQQQRITVPGGGTARFSLKPNAPLERLTIWAVSGTRDLVNMTFQPQINETNYGSSTAVLAQPAADVVYRSGGANFENDLIPFVSRSMPSIDPFNFSVLITNADATAADVTIFANGLHHQG